MVSVAYPLRIPSELVSIAKLRAGEEYVDQATALRQLLRTGGEQYVLQLLEDGRISIGRAAELLGQTIQDVMRLAKKNGVELGATQEQEEAAKKTAAKLFK